MAGEWIPIDCNLGTKPEVLELVDETGVPVEVAVYRLIQLWSWAAMNTADGTIRATPARVAAVAGGDVAFWLAVERVGWVSFLNGTIVIEGWGKRFSQAAKARAMHARRQDSYRWRSRDGAPSQGGDAGESLQDSTRQDRREEEEIPAAPVPTSKPKPVRSPAKPAVSWSADDAWQGITDADRSEWATAFPGAAIDQELAKATAWLRANPKRCGKRNWRRFLVGWLQRCQDKGGTHREPGNRPAGPPPVDPARRRFYRADAGRNMTDAEYAVWQRDRNSGGTTAALATALRLTEEART
jgi:hypothetical protein